MRTRLVLLFLILSLLCIPVYLQPIRQVSGFMLALQWPNSYCIEPPYCEPPIPQKFTIHGLWPLDFHGNVMNNEFARWGDVYFQRVEPGIEKELNESWPNLEGKNYNSRFWNYEWGRHGQGFGFTRDRFGRTTPITPHDYFRLAIGCKQNLDSIIGGDLAQYLTGIGFGPSATAEYGNQLVPRKIRDKTHFIAQIRCNMSADGKFQLWEIYICFTVAGRLGDCNNDYNGNRILYKAWECGKRSIIFPA